MSGRILRLGLPALVVLALAVTFAWIPARSSVRGADERTDSALRMVDEFAWEIEGLTAVESLAPALRAEKADHERAIPAEHGLAEVILDLQMVADEAGMELLDVVPTSILGSFDDAATPAGTSSIVVAVALRGSFSATIEMLDLLLRLPRLVVVESIAAGTDELSDLLAVDVNLRVFTTAELIEFEDEFLDDFEDGFGEEAVDDD